jgi:arabinose-5-phosphate isomerase
MRGDLVLALSASGETAGILELLPTIKRLGVPLVTLTGDCLHGGDGNGAKLDNPLVRSSLALAADVALDCSIQKEACSLGLAPTASTTTMLAMGDALAVELSERRGFRAEDFADLHPGGKLGKRLARVSQLMHSGEAIPRVGPETPMAEVIYEMSRKGLGVTAVVECEALIGIVSDGDLRRLLEHRGKDALDLTAGQCMTAKPRTIGAESFAAEALDLMEQKKITSLMVVGEGNRLEGVVHLHDLWGVELV